MKTTLKVSLLATALAFTYTAASHAQEAPPAAQPATQPAAPAAPTPPSLTPSMGGLAANASPYSVDLSDAPGIGQLLGKPYVSGWLTGLAQYESNHIPGDHETIGDLSNGQVMVQKVDGVFQYYVQAGAYSLPYIGTPYVKAGTNTSATYGVMPQAFVKLAPTSALSIEAGKLPTLIGSEYTFSVQNLNIQRGLLWGQEPAVSDGAQINYTMGPWAFAVSVNDGLYSGKWSWVSASAVWTINSANTIAFVGGGNTTKDYKNTFATPVLQNNEQIYNIIYTYTKGPWVISPYIQYTHVPTLPGIATTSASTYAGALLVKYTVNSDIYVAGRAEYEGSSGNLGGTQANLLGYGTGSDAWSLTLTPTFQHKIYFLRAEASLLHVGGAAPGAAFGLTGNDHSQFRLLAETGIVF